ncbi:DUF4376 domain-containing protein [Bradyrhizobium neotropicale]|uniref:DUF4376 domain-containing protein n=1 Tax=Bradyrhizobium neotropicale TaxID=1497615 RepID=UPI001AD635CE|nr:DUF4376 domain-containing protein [Bradyrhizobium neotropicale]MBO4221940.1 DUF4376 domain-containing protein [Bradyrhizobium neotropicale]
MYNPFDWYWLADDGRIFASGREMLVPADDAAYVAFCEGNAPTPWPRDGDGNQTPAELQKVLFPYRLAVDLKAYAFMVRDQKEHDGCPITGVTGVTETRTDAYTQSLISRYREVATTNASFTVPWVLPDRSTVMLDKAAIDSMYDQGNAFIVGTYNTYGQVITGIDGGTITTSDQIDQAFGTSPRRSAPVDIGWKL